MSDTLQELVPARVIPALEANLAALWASYGRLPHATLHDAPDLCWVATDLPFPPFNGVVRAQLHPATVGEAIPTILQQFVRRQVPMLWLLSPSTSPADLDRHLVAHGLVPYGEDPGMALDLHTLPPALPTPVPCEKPILGIRGLSSTPVIVMEHAAQDVSPLDWTIPRGALHQ